MGVGGGRRGREEGEGRKKGREGERGKFCTCEARAAPEGRRETRGREGGGKGGGLPSCPPLISNTLSPAMITLLHDNRMLTQWINEIYATISNEKGNLSSKLRIIVQT